VDGGAHLDADAALFAALNAPRDGQMHDVVATIQAEQDRIIRAPLPGVLVVQGGPGTGKTVVALHRAAYLLYAHRDRLRSGVLVVGPGQRFLDYISQVLPSLGEDGTTLRTLGRLHDGCDAHATDLPAVAALKGELRMAGVLAAAVADLRHLPPAAVPLDVDGTLIHLHPADVAAAARAALQERLPHNEGRVPFVNNVLERLLRHLATALGHRPGELADGERLELLRTLHASLDVRRAVNRCWPMVTAEQLVRRLLSTPGVLDRCAPGLTAEERALLRRPREAAWTVSDVPLLAEAAALLGEDPEPRRRAAARAVAERAAEVRYARGVRELTGPAGAMVDAATLADRYAGAQEVDDAADATVFGHVVVDEAQELTPMQWRAVLRRCPTRSLTVVGDMAQATSPGAATSWARALAPHLGDRWMLRELTVNYRLPQAINEFAQGVLSAAGVAATPFWSVRDGHDPLHQHHLPDVAAAARLAARLARQERAGSGAGSVAIICPPQHQAAIERVLDRRASDGERPVRILGANEVKGLEFDVVLVVDPDAIDAAAGPRSLFVALTRATQRLHVLTVSAGTGDLADGARP
jgi:DNA helicase IV